MNAAFDPEHLNLSALAHAAQAVHGEVPLGRCVRLAELAPNAAATTPVQFTATGQLRQDPTQDTPAPQVWLHLAAQVCVPLVCQRCLDPVDVPLAFARAFRFVATEAEAACQDESSEEDVLVLSADFDLLALVEDELLLALPLAPKHAVCPQPLPTQVADPDFVEADPVHPFAALGQLKSQG